MNCTDCSEKLSDHLDGSLAPADARTVTAHLAQCPACRRELDSLRALRTAAAALKKEIAPARDLWPEIKSQLGAERADPNALSDLAPRKNTMRSPRSVLWPALALAASLALVAGVMWWQFHPPAPAAFSDPTPAAWAVTSTAGSPRVGEKNFQGEARLRVGQWLETDATARARLAVGAIGEVRVEPNSRLRLVSTTATNHRLELTRGTLSAFIWAPPRLFFVNTPSATAVDLGCAYTLAVDDAGDGELRVTSGYVALEEGDRESIIPTQFMCLTRRGAGPGTPFAVDAPPALKSALQRFDFPAAAPFTASALADLLAQARPADAVTLWHLLARVPPTQRSAVFDALAAHHAPPPGVTRAGILAGDAAMRRAWAADLGLGTFARR